MTVHRCKWSRQNDTRCEICVDKLECRHLYTISLQGTTFPFSPCGHGFMPDSTSPQLHGGGGEEGVGGIDFKKTEVTMNIDRLVETLNQVGVCVCVGGGGGGGGVYVCACLHVVCLPL